MHISEKFTYPFCYIPSKKLVEESQKFIDRVDCDYGLKAKLSDGKMIGILRYAQDGMTEGYIYAFSGTVSGLGHLECFVPAIFDYTDPDGYFKSEEAAISRLTFEICHGGGDAERILELREQRRHRSEALQSWLFEHYIVHNARGESLSIKEIFALRGLTPPGGTGDCAAPKLLEHAYRHGLRPLEMGEFWYGRSPAGEVRHQGRFYPACMGKCGPLLDFMMQGLDIAPNPLEDSPRTEPEIFYEDDSLMVVNKPPGLLSVPGRTSARDLTHLLSAHNSGHPVLSCHRLDMDTSGLMVYAKTPEVKSALEAQFARRETVKKYRARLCAPDGDARPLRPGDSGIIDLPLALDYYDRPRQMVDFELGKKAVTMYEVLSEAADGSVEVEFRPLTGRTHQLRVHAAHKLGLCRPIVGDRLYGGATTPEGPGAGQSAGLLYLQAVELDFTHPATSAHMHFSLPCRWEQSPLHGGGDAAAQ